MFGLIDVLEYNKIKKQCRLYQKNKNFDMSSIDNKISLLAEKIYSKNQNKFKKFSGYYSEIGFMASCLYDTGGHTPCLINLASSLYGDKKMFLFLSKLKQTHKKAPIAVAKLEKICGINGVSYNGLNFEKSLIDGYNQIIDNLSQVLVLYIAQHDIYSTALVYLLKKNTDVKILFFNHASHFPNLAMTHADKILEGMQSCVEITNKKRYLKNCEVVKLQSKKKSDVKYYNKEEIDKKRGELGILKTDLLTVSGGTSYKYFENGKSQHYEMIKRLLIKFPNLKHLAITNLDYEQKNIIDDIFKDDLEVKKRLIIHNLTPKYDLLFQCADLFIDSFPISSALTQIDLMSMKIPSVVKINNEAQEFSFQEYMPKNYEYMFESVEEMENGIVELLNSKEKRAIVAKSNYHFWLNEYESEIYKNRILKIIREIINR